LFREQLASNCTILLCLETMEAIVEGFGHCRTHADTLP